MPSVEGVSLSSDWNPLSSLKTLQALSFLLSPCPVAAVTPLFLHLARTYSHTLTPSPPLQACAHRWKNIYYETDHILPHGFCYLIPSNLQAGGKMLIPCYEGECGLILPQCPLYWVVSTTPSPLSGFPHTDVRTALSVPRLTLTLKLCPGKRRLTGDSGPGPGQPPCPAPEPMVLFTKLQR